MAYYTVDRFLAGLDLRRSALTAPAESLRKIVNAHITPGGEIEKRSPFRFVTKMPPWVVGLGALDNDVYAFQHAGPERAFRFPDGKGTMFLKTHPSPSGAAYTPPMLDFEAFDGRPFVTLFDDTAGTTRWYDGQIVATDGRDGTMLRTLASKMHLVGQDRLTFTAVGDPTDFTGTGSGQIELSQQAASRTGFLGLEIYQNNLAVMSKTVTMIWATDPDPDKYQLLQVLNNIGTIAPRSVRQYGSGDVFFLDQSGIRSLRARDSSNSAAVNDIGSPIDARIRELLIENGQDYVWPAVSLVEPQSGRFWLVLPDRVLVLSHFPGPQVTAWSEYEFDMLAPGEKIIGAAARSQTVVLLTNEGRIYSYDSLDDWKGAEPVSARIVTPYMDLDKPAMKKNLQGLDVAASGGWDVYGLMNPHNDARTYLARVERMTYADQQVPVQGRTTHLALVFENQSAAPATISAFAIHYAGGKSD